ncbi:hypothetical protein K1719_033020 [Acacia pycnantha]|nr:hypothetical protein K1719_033020 [Acacia pycnantha]
MASSPSLSNRPPLFTLRTLTPASVSFPPSSLKISLTSYSCLRTRLRLPNSCTTPRFRVTCGAGIAEINETQFSETVLKADRPVLVEFVANWCGPCRLISPIMEWVAQEYGDRLTVVKIDHDANPKLIEEFKVYGLPTLILFKNGQEVPESRREGAIAKMKLKEHLDALLKSISVT